MELIQETVFQNMLEKALADEECFKRHEMHQIEVKILQTKSMLQKLRMCLISQDKEGSAITPIVPLQTWSQFEEQLKKSESINSLIVKLEPADESDTTSDVTNSEVKFKIKSDQLIDSEVTMSEDMLWSSDFKLFDDGIQLDNSCTNNEIKLTNVLANNVKAVSNFDVKHSVVVGNTSQYLKKLAHSNDKVTHKWMIYVRSLRDEVPLESFTKSVIFFLHPTYAPNDIVTVSRPPFQLTKFGWGEFPVRIQLQFHDSLNKPIDILHPLKLDQTHSGEQMLGAETHVNIEIVQRSVLPCHVNNSSTRIDSTPPSSSPLCEPKFSPTPFSIYSSQLVPPQTVSSPPTLTPCSLSPPLSPPLKFSPDQTLFTNRSASSLDTQSPPLSPQSPSSKYMYVTLPIKVAAHSVLLDHDYHKQTLVKYAYTKKPITKKSKPLTNSSQIDTLMHVAVRQLSLYGSSHSFSAQSFAQYCDWSLPKQRANEWMRAVAVKHYLYQFECHFFPSTRQIVSWCRSHGYTPLKSKDKFCKVCGHPIMNNQHDNCIAPWLSTLTESIYFTESLNASKSSRCETIDVTSDNDNYPIENNNDIVYRIPQFPELRWINKTSNEVGVVLCPISHDKMLLHVVDHMMFSACSQFLCQLLRKAVSVDSVEGNVVERIVTPLHIYNSIRNIPKFDFLTNNGLGLSIL